MSASSVLRSAYGLPHLFNAAHRTISDRFSGERAFALAAPPASPPERANSCAGVGGSSCASVFSPVARSAIILPSWLESRGRLGCFVMR